MAIFRHLRRAKNGLRRGPLNKAGLLACVAAFAAFSVALTSCGGPPPPDPDRASHGAIVMATAEEIAAGQVLEGSYIVTFRPPPSSRGAGLLRFPSYMAESRKHHFLVAESRLSDPRVKDINFLTAIDLAPSTPDRQASWSDFGGVPALLRLAWDSSPDEPQVGSVSRVDFLDEESARSALAEWEQNGAVWFAEPNYISRLSQQDDTLPPPPENLFESLATDYGQYSAWWLTAINLTKAYEAIATRPLDVAGTPTDEQILASRPIIAVLDSGVDYEHPALKGRMWTNNDVNASNCTGDVHGCNTTVAKRGTLGNGEVFPYATSGPGENCVGKDANCSHGTHVAGIIAADHSVSGPGRAVAGICPVCQIMAVKIVTKVGNDSGILDSAIIAAFKYVTLFRKKDQAAVRVINASFGKFVRSRTVGLLIRILREERGTLIIAAAGNEDTLTMEYPAAFSDAIAVAAVDSRLRKVSFSNFGRWVDVAAPGQAILSTVPGGVAESKSGTSMAAPIVAGVAGLMLARYPDISFDELRSVLIQSADPGLYRSDFEDGYNYTYYYPEVPSEKLRQPLLGTGLVNAEAAINRRPSEGLPLFTDLDRVTSRCGVVADVSNRALLPLAAPLLLPIILLVTRRRSRRK